MRLQLPPIILCLAIVLFCTSGFANNKQKSVVTHSFTVTIGHQSLSSSLYNYLTIHPASVNKSNQVKQLITNNSLDYNKSTIASKSVNSYNLKENTNSTSILNKEAINSLGFTYGLYYGILIMLALVNLACYFFFKEKLFLFFSILVFTLGAMLFINDGLYQLFSVTLIENNIVLTSGLLFLTALCSSIFSSNYLETLRNYPKFDSFNKISLGISLVFICIGILTQIEAIFTIATVFSLLVIAGYFLIGVFDFSKKNHAKFYVIASFIPILFLVDYFILTPMGLHFLGTENLHLKSAIFIEILLLTYAILYRMEIKKEENDIQKIEMQLFLNNEEVMGRDRIEDIVHDIYLENLIMMHDLDGTDIKILQYISEGKENNKIARRLKTSEKEVELIISELYYKLQVDKKVVEDQELIDNQPDYIYN